MLRLVSGGQDCDVALWDFNTVGDDTIVLRCSSDWLGNLTWVKAGTFSPIYGRGGYIVFYRLHTRPPGVRMSISIQTYFPNDLIATLPATGPLIVALSSSANGNETCALQSWQPTFGGAPC